VTFIAVLTVALRQTSRTSSFDRILGTLNEFAFDRGRSAKKYRSCKGDDMSKVELPRATDRRFKAEDFRSEAFRKDALERERSEDEMNCGGGVNLQKLEEQLVRGPVDEIAALMRALTYGEMIELAEGLWNVNGQGSEISKDNLPGLLHRWSTSRTA
jgi:hypothetical protein